jgi:hypothetical protein
VDTEKFSFADDLIYTPHLSMCLAIAQKVFLCLPKIDDVQVF